jgi:NAD(P)H-nitrite reductase large subunit
MHHVIIGNGIAGVQAAEAIRYLDPESEISMIAAETFPPYCRPMISLLLEGVVTPDRLPIRPENFYESRRIRAFPGVRATAIDSGRARLSLDTGETLAYDRLLIATGADPRSIRAEGKALAGIFPMRTVSDVQKMLDMLPSCKSALVLGGGLVGFKAACSLLKRGMAVTMLIASDYPLSMQLDPVSGGIIRDTLVRHGLSVETGVEVLAFEGNGRVQRAILNDGRVLACDLVVVGKGVRPATGFLAGSGVEVDLGIRVDEHLQTTVSGVFAAGDVAELTDVVRNRPWINAIWPEAAAQGWIAGLNMAGRSASYRGSLGRNVIRMFDLDIMTAGIVQPQEDSGTTKVLTHFDKNTPIYRKFVLQEDRLIGFTLINRIEKGGMLVSLIQRGLPLDPEEKRLLLL